MPLKKIITSFCQLWSLPLWIWQSVAFTKTLHYLFVFSLFCLSDKCSLYSLLFFDLFLMCVQRILATAFADSSFLDQQVCFHSSTGDTVFLEDTLIAWALKKQPTVVQSSAKAEFIMTTEAVKEILWTKNVISKIQEILPKWKLKGKPILAIDLRACQDMIQNGCFEHGRMKHISYQKQFIFEECAVSEEEAERVRGEERARI